MQLVKIGALKMRKKYISIIQKFSYSLAKELWESFAVVWKAGKGKK